VLAHFGGSIVWGFSTTLLQLNTDDRFRGRGFAAGLGLCMLIIAIGALVCGRLFGFWVLGRVLLSSGGPCRLCSARLLAWGSQVGRPAAKEAALVESRQVKQQRGAPIFARLPGRPPHAAKPAPRGDRGRGRPRLRIISIA